MLPCEPMVAAVRAAGARGVKTGLVSNSWSTSHYDRDLLEELFDTVVISADVGLHKPQPEIYLMAAERIVEPPERCVFVDDLRENCAGAEAVGMTAVLHRDPAATIERIERLFGIKVPVEPA
jgi:epoxide hydrolase-like predicted phosphatase